MPEMQLRFEIVTRRAQIYAVTAESFQVTLQMPASNSSNSEYLSPPVCHSCRSIHYIIDSVCVTFTSYSSYLSIASECSVCSRKQNVIRSHSRLVYALRISPSQAHDQVTSSSHQLRLAVSEAPSGGISLLVNTSHRLSATW